MILTYVHGFDLSLRQSGWACHENKSLARDAKIPATDVCPLFASSTDPLFDVKRLKHILGWVKGMIGSKGVESLIVIEGISFNSVSSSSDQIAGMHYLIRYWLVQSGIKYLVVPPSTLKKFVVGSGNAKKEQMLKAVYKAFLVDVSTSDEADAVGLVYVGRAFLGWWEPTNQPQRDVIKDLRKKNQHLLEDATKW